MNKRNSFAEFLFVRENARNVLNFAIKYVIITKRRNAKCTLTR